MTFLFKNDVKNIITPNDLCKRIFYTTYMPSDNSSSVTRSAAESIAKEISSNHSVVPVKNLYNMYLKTVDDLNFKKPKYKT